MTKASQLGTPFLQKKWKMGRQIMAKKTARRMGTMNPLASLRPAMMIIKAENDIRKWDVLPVFLAILLSMLQFFMKATGICFICQWAPEHTGEKPAFLE